MMKRYLALAALTSLTLWANSTEASKRTRVVPGDEFLLSTETKQKKKRNFDPEVIHEQLGLLFKGYYLKRQESAISSDDWGIVLKHPEAKKYFQKNDWPYVGRKNFERFYTDTKGQYENFQLIIHTLLQETARALMVGDEDDSLDEDLDIRVEDMDDEELDAFREAARIFHDLQFNNAEREVDTKLNLLNYLTKCKPEPIAVNTSLEDFLEYAKQEGFKLPKGYRKKGKRYLNEYFFPE